MKTAISVEPNRAAAFPENATGTFNSAFLTRLLNCLSLVIFYRHFREIITVFDTDFNYTYIFPRYTLLNALRTLQNMCS